MEALPILTQIMTTCGLPAPRTLQNTQDSNVLRALACANRALRQISAEYLWRELRRDITFKASDNHPAYKEDAGGFEISKLAPDFESVITAALYENGSYLPIKYLSPADFKLLQVTGVGAPCKYFTDQGEVLKFLPKPGQTPYEVTFVYQSKYSVFGEGTLKPYITKDEDEYKLDEELLILLGVCKLKQELRLDYADDKLDYERRLENLKNRQTIAPVLGAREESCAPDNPRLSARRAS